MKKEIEVWVPEEFEADMRHLYSTNVTYRNSMKNQLKAKLIIELPEKSIKLKKSEFEKSWNEAGGSSYSALKIMLTEKLFGER